MADYNTFIVQPTKGGKPLLITSSARKAKRMLAPGLRVEVWNENRKVETIHTRTLSNFDPYVAEEKEYIRAKQATAEKRNQLRRAHHAHTT